jgi:protein phosphatase
MSLVDHLRTKETTMKTTGPVLTTRSAWQLGQGVRTAQQDALHAGSSLFVVADGFGPHKSAVPADLAISALVAMDAPWDAADGDPSAALLAAVAEAERTITAESSALADPNHFGTTLTAALLLGSTLLSAHIGDSRLWLVRDGRTEQLTRDHTVVATLIEEGRLTEDEARSHKDRNLLNRAIVPAGARGHTDTGPDLAATTVHPGDRIVLTGDGVHAVLDPARLVSLMVQEGDPDVVGQKIADAVEEAGAPDNYALVVVDLMA